MTNRLTEQEIAPCPFCGGEALINVIEPHDHYFVNLPRYEGTTFIECTNCTCTICASDRDKATKDWNRRADSAQIALLRKERDAAVNRMCHQCKHIFSESSAETCLQCEQAEGDWWEYIGVEQEEQEA